MQQMGNVFLLRSDISQAIGEFENAVVAITPGMTLPMSRMSHRLKNIIGASYQIKYNLHPGFTVSLGEAVPLEGYADINDLVVGMATGEGANAEEARATYGQEYISLFEYAVSANRSAIHYPLLTPMENPQWLDFKIAYKTSHAYAANHPEINFYIYSVPVFLFSGEHQELFAELILYANRFSCFSSEVKFSINLKGTQPRESETGMGQHCGKSGETASSRPSLTDEEKLSVELEKLLSESSVPLKDVLQQFIKDKEMSPADVYKSANIDRRVYAKIINIPDYHPRKETLVALSLAMKLDLQETQRLLSAAGYILGENQKFDIIITFFLEKKCYDIDIVNQSLLYYNLPLLGSF